MIQKFPKWFFLFILGVFILIVVNTFLILHDPNEYWETVCKVNPAVEGCQTYYISKYIDRESRK